MPQKILPVLAGISIALIFGLSFLFSKEALSSLAPLELLAHRFSLATVILVLLMVFKVIDIKFRPKMIKDLFPLVLFQPIVYFLGETYGVKQTTATEAGLVIALIPIVVTFLGNIFLHEKATKKQWIFIWLSVIGVAMIIFSDTGVVFGEHSVGIIYLMVAVIAAAFYNILSRKLSNTYSPIEITFVMMVTGAIFFNIINFSTMPQKAVYFSAYYNYKTLLSLIYLGGLSSVVAFFLLNYMLKQLPASRAATFINLTTIVSIIAGVGFRGERFEIIQLLGGGLILLGVCGSNLYKPIKKE